MGRRRATPAASAADGGLNRHVAAETGDPPLLTEFGATTDQPTLRGMVRRAATHLTGWQYWAYCGCDDPTTTHASIVTRDGSSSPRSIAAATAHPGSVRCTQSRNRQSRAQSATSA